ncbi:MAG: tetratricopeptide repeat protein [Planctomycetota bacterium]|nr:tetratricopeptide repeat protein [Planctomycetota bacterium]
MHLTQRGKRRIIILITGLVIVAIALGGVYAFRDVYRTRLAAKSRDAGMTAYQEGDYATALMKLNYPLQRNPDDLEALLAFADCRLKIIEVNNRHIRQAEARFRDVLQLDQDNLVALEQLLWIYGRLENRLEAMDVVDHILRVNPDHIDALATKYALLYSKLKAGERFDDDPEQIARRLMELEPDKINWRKFILELMRIKQVPNEQIIAMCDEWIEGYEGDGRLELLKAETQMVLGDDAASRVTALAAAALGADSLDVLDLMLSLFDVLSMMSPSDPVLSKTRQDLLDRTRQRFPTEAWVYVAIIRQHWRNGHHAMALQVMEQAMASSVEMDDQFLRWKALLFMSSNRSAEAEAAVNELLDRVADLPVTQRDASRAWSQAIRSRLNVGEIGWPETIESLSRAGELNRRDPILQYLLGEAYQQIDEHDLATRVFAMSIHHDPLWVKPYVSMGRSLLRLRRPELAINTLTDLLRRSPNASPEATVLLAEAWIAAGRSVTQIGLLSDGKGNVLDLIGMLELMYERTGGYAQLARLLMEAYLTSGDEETATHFAQRVMQEDDPSLDTLLAFSQLMREFDPELSSRLLDKAQERHGFTPGLLAMQALLLIEQGEIEQGIGLLDQAVENAASADERRTAMMNLAMGIARCGHRRTNAILHELLREIPDSYEPAKYVLTQPAAWEDRALIDASIDQMARITGENSPRVLLARGNAVLRFESEDPAKMAVTLSRISEVLETTPDSLPALILMAELLLGGDNPDPEKAVLFLQRAVDVYPTVWALYPRLISSLQSLEDFDLANVYLQRFTSRTEDATTLQHAERKLLEVQGDFETLALRMHETLDPDASVEERLMLASLYQRTGQFDLAEQTFEQLLTMAPNHELLAAQAAAFYARRNQVDRALALLEAFVHPEHPSRANLMIGWFHARRGEASLARQAFKEAIKLEPDDLEAINQYVRFSIESGSMGTAMSELERGLKLDPTSEGLRKTKAIALLQLGAKEQRQALEIIASLGESHRQWLETERLAQRVRAQAEGPMNRDLAEARLLIEKYVRYLPAWRLAVNMHSNVELRDEAIQLAQQASSTLPFQAEPMEWATRLLILDGQIDQALVSARSWRERLISDPFQADVIIASLLIERGHIDQALQQLDPHEPRFVRMASESSTPVAVWLRVLMQDGVFDRAVPLLRDHQNARQRWYALCRDLEIPQALTALALVSQYRGDTTTEIFLLSQEWALLGRRAHDMACLDEADQLVRLIEDDMELKVQVLLLKATIAAGRNDSMATESYYRQALSLDPRNPGLLNNLAYTLLRLDPASPEALQLSSRALDLLPGNPDLLDTYGTALLGAGQFDAAAQVILQAIAGDSQSPTPRLTLAKIRFRQGRFDEAMSHVMRAQLLLEAMPVRDEMIWAEAQELMSRIEQQAAAATS